MIYKLKKCLSMINWFINDKWSINRWYGYHSQMGGL